jgi:hypothetical protein
LWKTELHNTLETACRDLFRNHHVPRVHDVYQTAERVEVILVLPEWDEFRDGDGVGGSHLGRDLLTIEFGGETLRDESI